jgi:nucleoside-diphosphate-sugar epimerase
MPSPAVVLGAGGKMGLHLCLMLQEAAKLAGRKDLRIVAVSRFKSLRDRASFTDAGIETIACDLSEPREVTALPDAGTVFYLAGVKFGTSSSPELLERMNIAAPRLVAERYKAASIVAFSTGCVYPFVSVESGGATEATALGPVGAYAESCVRREEAFTDAARRHGTRVALIRLNYAVEFRYGVLVDIATSVQQSRPIDVTMGHVNAIWQTDALNHIIQAHAVATNPAQPVNITGADVLSVRTMAERFGTLMGIPPVIVGRETSTAWLSNASWSHQRFGVPETDLETKLAWITSWLLAGGATWGKPTHFESRDGNF